MTVKVESHGASIRLSRTHQDLVLSVHEAPELVRQLQAIIRAHTIQQQTAKDDRSL